MSKFAGKIQPTRCPTCQTPMTSVVVEPQHTVFFFNIDAQPHVAVDRTRHPLDKYLAMVCPKCTPWSPCTGQEMAWLKSKTERMEDENS